MYLFLTKVSRKPSVHPTFQTFARDRLVYLNSATLKARQYLRVITTPQNYLCITNFAAGSW